MNILRTAVFRRIRHTELLISMLMPAMPAAFMLRQLHFDSLFRLLLPVAAVIATIRLLLLISLSNYLAEAAEASQHFYHAKNWFLMQSVTDAAAQMLNVAMNVIKNMLIQDQTESYILMLTGYLVYLLILQTFDMLAKERLMRGFGEVWYQFGGDPAQNRSFLLTRFLQYLSFALYVPLTAGVIMQPFHITVPYILAGCAMFLIMIVQFRITRHAHKISLHLAALSE